MNTAIYTRSCLHARHDLALYEYDLIALAYEQGATSLHHYDDAAAGTLPISARPGLSRLIEDIRLSKINLVIAASLDRLARHGEDLDALANVLSDADVPLHTLEQGRIDLTERTGGRPGYETGKRNISATGLSEGR